MYRVRLYKTRNVELKVLNFQATIAVLCDSC